MMQAFFLFALYAFADHTALQFGFDLQDESTPGLISL